MDTIEFRIARSEYARQAVSLLINGTDLIKLVREFETPIAQREGAPHIAGSYAPLSKDAFKKDHAEALNGTPYKPKLSLYCCKDCGEVGCWPLDAKITIQGNQVTWSDFEQPHREEWDYGTFGPFKFDAKAYQQAPKSRRPGRPHCLNQPIGTPISRLAQPQPKGWGTEDALAAWCQQAICAAS